MLILAFLQTNTKMLEQYYIKTQVSYNAIRIGTHLLIGEKLHGHKAQKSCVGSDR